MKIYELNKLSKKRINGLYARRSIDFESVSRTVAQIISRVRREGDEAVISYTEQFDGINLTSLTVPAEEIKLAGERLPEKSKQALRQASENIKKFHELQLQPGMIVETMPGVVCFSEMRPVEKVGLYVPGGSAPLPSTVLMLGIPAKLAGCKEIILCSPADGQGGLPDSILYAALLCGISKIYKIGGAQAIAAMAYGTGTVPKVYKIFGPGNQYVTTAKLQVSVDPDGADIDMPAGPTELLVIADETARPDFVASDLLSQAEHGPDSQVVLVCLSKAKAIAIMEEINKQINDLPRKQIAEKSLENSFAAVADNLDQAMEFSNGFAPEHLVLNVKDPEQLTGKVINAGSVFLGAYSCESAGDYASGTNHTLPTYGYARTYGGVSAGSFQKQITFQKISRQGAKNIGPVVAKIASMEGLEAHKRAMEIRMEQAK